MFRKCDPNFISELFEDPGLKEKLKNLGVSTKDGLMKHQDIKSELWLMSLKRKKTFGLFPDIISLRISFTEE
jgi:hypothetical protein